MARRRTAPASVDPPPVSPDVQWRRCRWFMLGDTRDPTVAGYRDLITSLADMRLTDEERVDRAVAYLEHHGLREGFERFAGRLRQRS